MRIAERKEHDALKGHKYTFLKNRENLSEKKEKELDDMIKLYPTLGEAYRLKVLFNQPRSRRGFYILMVMCASITASKPNCPSIMLPGRNSVFERPPTIGSMPWMVSLLWWLIRPWTPA